ncbi:helix-turn-helix domain-containing protein [Chitinophaga barathri]|uniref:DNA-binding protein n=1 Tax=Chitinophaga barathri TaxID=1647451 RepID=A0A3N4M7U3_9BACT|nr:helix-turn-helix domain-containing protein [Chitinophaga barathri]RPD39431.1 DNA-binding protein [Chitinophaga barathri]
MAAEIITQEDLQLFKEELFSEIRDILSSQQQAPPKKWIKSYQVMEILGISSGTLQTMRNKGAIAFSKMGGLIFYDYDAILELMKDSAYPGTPMQKRGR